MKPILTVALSVAVFSSSSFAVEPLKRLGQGVGDRKTREKLQLACVGAKKEGSLERGCEFLRFLHTDAGGHEKLVGPVIDLSDAGDRAGRELREELRCFGFFRHDSTGRFFFVTQGLFGRKMREETRGRCADSVYYSRKGKKRRELGPKGRDIVIPMLWAGAGAGAALTALAVGPVGVVVVIPGVFASMFVADAITYPFRLLSGGPGGALGTRAKNVEALESRAKTAWQLKPKYLSHRRFARVMAQLEIHEGRGPKTDVATAYSGEVVEVVGLDDASVAEDTDFAIDAGSTPESRPDEWTASRRSGIPGEN